MKTIQTTKRLYTAIPRNSGSSIGALSSSPPKRATSLRRHRSDSSSISNGDRRTLYTNTGSSGLPLHYFDSGAPPPTPLHSSRPCNSQVISTSRLAHSGESQTQPIQNGQGTNSSSQTAPAGPPQPSQGQIMGSPPVTLALTSVPSASQCTERPYSLSTSTIFPHQQWNTSSSSTSSASLGGEHQKADARVRKYQFDVGAYGIPKRCRTQGTLPEHERLELAVQVGEDAYFVRDDAMGVADGVGGWNRMSSSGETSSAMSGSAVSDSASFSTERRPRALSISPRRKRALPSPSALFALRLMHFCSYEVAQVASCKCPPLPKPPILSMSPTTSLASPYPTRAPRTSLPSPRNRGNARPFAWPWDEPCVMDLNEDLTGLNFGNNDHVKIGEERLKVNGSEEPQNDRVKIDPVEILEKAYQNALKVQVASSSASLGPNNIRPTATDAAQQTQHRLPGSSTALLAVLSGETLRIAHLGDCTGLLVRAGEIVWRSEEMWWSFNYPLQLGPSSSTRPSDARTYMVDVKQDDILILASDGMSDNLWEEDVLDEVKLFNDLHTSPPGSPSASIYGESIGGLLGRRTLAGMLSEALCSRAKSTAEKAYSSQAEIVDERAIPDDDGTTTQQCASASTDDPNIDDVPFARRAREEGRSFRGGKSDDISVLVAIISPANPCRTAEP